MKTKLDIIDFFLFMVVSLIASIVVLAAPYLGFVWEVIPRWVGFITHMVAGVITAYCLCRTKNNQEQANQ